MEKKNYIYFLFGLFLGILLTLIYSNFHYLIEVFDKHAGSVTIISIVFAIMIFIGAEWIKKSEHDKNQKAQLRTLKYKIDEIEKMIESYKKQSIPFYLLPLPNESLYYRILDYEIDKRSTNDLKKYINRIEDKSRIINFMMIKIQDSFNVFINSKNKRYDFILKDKIYNYYHLKIMDIINDNSDKKGLLYSLEQTRCILRERFNIY